MSRPEFTGGPVERIELLGAIIDDERARLIHIKTARHILKRYFQKFGNARASVSYLQEATGLTRGSVASATEDLVSWGYFTRTMGSGKRPTEYHPNFSVLQPSDASSVLPSPDATKTTVLQPQDERVLQPQDAKSPSVLQPQDQTLLQYPATAAVTVKETSRPARAHGLAAAPSGSEAGSDVRPLLRLTVKTAAVSEEDETYLYIAFEDHAGEEHDDIFIVASNDQNRQAEGQKRLNEMTQAMELQDVGDASELEGKRVDAVFMFGELRFVSQNQWSRASTFAAWRIVDHAVPAAA